MTVEDATAVLTQHGLRVTPSQTTPKKASKASRPVWLVTGRVEPFRQLLYDQGGSTRFTGRNTFSFWSDPTLELAEQIAASGEASLEEQVAFQDERSLSRANRYAERADRQRSKSQAAHDRAHAAVDGIPMGQPILVGHHSERHHRRALDNSHRAMGQAVEAGKYAQHLEQKADGSQRQVEHRHTLEYMGNRLEEAKTKQRQALKQLDQCPDHHSAQLALQDAEAAIAHWQAEIQASGGMLDSSQIRPGDFICFIGSWYEVVRVNKKSVSIKGWHGIADWTYTVPYHKIQGHRGSTAP